MSWRQLPHGGMTTSSPVRRPTATTAWISRSPAVNAVPMATEAIAMYVNLDLVPEPPTSIEEIAELCPTLDGIENCIGVPGGGDGGDLYHNIWLITAQGGYIFGYDAATGYDTTDVGLDSEGAVAGAEVISQLTADGIMASTTRGCTWVVALQSRSIDMQVI